MGGKKLTLEGLSKFVEVR